MQGEGGSAVGRWEPVGCEGGLEAGSSCNLTFQHDRWDPMLMAHHPWGLNIHGGLTIHETHHPWRAQIHGTHHPWGFTSTGLTIHGGSPPTGLTIHGGLTSTGLTIHRALTIHGGLTIHGELTIHRDSPSTRLTILRTQHPRGTHHP